MPLKVGHHQKKKKKKKKRPVNGCKECLGNFVVVQVISCIFLQQDLVILPRLVLAGNHG